jgi:hypothetical protein
MVPVLVPVTVPVMPALLHHNGTPVTPDLMGNGSTDNHGAGADDDPLNQMPIP